MMKPLFTLLTIIVMSQVQAQGLDFGIKAGLNYANVSGIEDFNQRQASQLDSSLEQDWGIK